MLTGFQDSGEKDRTAMVYRLEKYDLKIMFTHLDQRNPDVVVTLGSEARTFQLEGFINFWLDMLKVGRKAADAHLVLTGFADSIGKDGTPLACGLKRHGLKIRITHLDHNKPDVVVTLGSEARTFQLEDFIDFWLEMTELVPKAVYAHLAYLEQLARQGRERSRGTCPSREPMNERRNAKQQAVGEAAAGNAKADKGAVWLISPDALATYNRDGAVVLDIPKGICYSLNATASRIWFAMESSPSGITLEGIVGAIETHFEIPHQELEADTADCLDKLERMGLLQANGHGIASSSSQGRK